MTDDRLKHRKPEESGEYERQDLSARGILGFLAGLGIFGVVIYFVLAGMYSYLDRYQREHQPPQNPLATATQADTRTVTSQDAKQFPQPRLETNEPGQMNDARQQEESTLNSYGWVDQKGGIAHIPIERAMELIAQRGLPTRPQNGAAKAVASRQRMKNRSAQ